MNNHMPSKLELIFASVFGVIFFFGLAWFFAIACVVMGHGPEVCGL